MERVNLVVSNCWKRKGTKLRLTTFMWGMSIATAFTAILGDKLLYFFCFLVVALLCNILTWKILNDIYCLDAAEVEIKKSAEGEQVTNKKIKGKAKRTVRFAKTFSILGNYLAAVAVLPILGKEKLGSFFSVGDVITGAMATTIMTVWIPFILIMIGKFIMKHNIKKNIDKAYALVREIYNAAESESLKIPADKNILGMRAMNGLGAVTAMLCVVMYSAVIISVIPRAESEEEVVKEYDRKKEDTEYEAISIKKIKNIAGQLLALGIEQPDSESQDTEMQAAQESDSESQDTGMQVTQEQDTEMQAAQEQEEQAKDSEDDWYNNPNSNGYNFELTTECLETYLAYVQSNEAKKSFADWHKSKNSEGFGGVTDGEVKYFSIAGMEKPEPYLIISSGNGTDISDEVAFYSYAKYGSSPGTVVEANIFENNYDMLSMAQTMTVNDLYVFCTEQKNSAIFYEETIMVYNNDASTEYANFYWIYKIQDGAPIDKIEWDKKSTSMVKTLLEKKEIAHIKWFSLDQIEEAREYYSQFAQDEPLTGVKEAANRDDYYSTTILQYTPYIDKGVFSVENKNGRETYRFSALSSDDAYALFFDANMNSTVQFEGLCSSTANRYVNIYVLDDGTYKAIERMLTANEYGSIIEIVELTSEEEIVNTYNYDLGESERVTSVAEIIEKES